MDLRRQRHQLRSLFWRNALLGRAISFEERKQLFAIERLVLFYLPRICNHCLNSGCLAACPPGAIYRRAEDCNVLVSRHKCRAWRMCISGCPYKKAYYIWATGNTEKCIPCYPRQETGQAPACFHACVGRVRFVGMVLYDADRIQETAERPGRKLVEAQQDLSLDPYDPAKIQKAEEDGVPARIIEAAQRSPVYQFVKEWELALPMHPEFRTVPMLFYVLPLLPLMASVVRERYRRCVLVQIGTDGTLFGKGG